MPQRFLATGMKFSLLLGRPLYRCIACCRAAGGSPASTASTMARKPAAVVHVAWLLLCGFFTVYRFDGCGLHPQMHLDYGCVDVVSKRTVGLAPWLWR